MNPQYVDIRTTFCTLCVYGALLMMPLTLARLSYAQSFTVIGDPVNNSDFGKEGSFLEEYYDENEIAFNSHVLSAASPEDESDDKGFLEDNWLDVGADRLGLDPLVAFGWPTAISGGLEPLDASMPWDLLFSLEQDHAEGQDGSRVNDRHNEFDAGVGATLFYQSNKSSHLGWNGAHKYPGKFGLRDIESADITSMEIYDSRFALEKPFKGFSASGAAALETDFLFFTTDGSPSIHRLNLNTNHIDTVHDFTSMGLDPSDTIDALAYDGEFLADSLTTDIYVGDSNYEALFSLDPASPSLAGNESYTPATIFYTNFDGTFSIAGPHPQDNEDVNLGWAFPLTAENLGLLPTDDVDALDLAFSAVIPDAAPADIPPGPWPGPKKGDMNGDGRVDNFDIHDFETALVNPEEYSRRYPYYAQSVGDINNDGVFDNFDIAPFEHLVAFGPGGQEAGAVPEPTAGLLALTGIALLWRCGRHGS